VDYAELMGYEAPDESVKEIVGDDLVLLVTSFASDQAQGATEGIPDFDFVGYIRHMIIAHLFAERIKAEIEIEELTK
jgi:hypothetical protein